MAAKFVRMGFHDCVGGCDGCIDLLNNDNVGLDIPMNVLQPIVDEHAINGVTRADIWALAALLGAEQSLGFQKVVFTFEWFGRPNCEMLNDVGDCVESNCTATRGPHRDLPGPDLDTHGVLEYFETTFGLDTQETIALMGAHSIGKVERNESGFVGIGWDTNPLILNNGYFIELIGRATVDDPIEDVINKALLFRQNEIRNDDLERFPNRHQWNLGDQREDHSTQVIMLNADIALVRNFTGQIGNDGEVNCTFKLGTNLCPVALDTIDHVRTYQTNNLLWLQHFRDVYEYMLEFPFKASNTTCGEEVVCNILDP
jgi:hypothetical protein